MVYYCKYCILDKKGLVPFTTLADLNKHIAQAHTDKPLGEDSSDDAAVAKTYEGKYEALYAAFGDKPLDAAASRAASWQRDAYDAWVTRVNQLIILETASMGLVDVSPSAYLNGPKFRAWLSTHEAIKSVRDECSLLAFLRRHFNHAYQAQLPPPDIIVQMGALGWLDWTTYVEHMKDSGIPDTWAYKWIKSREKYPDYDSARQMLWRGSIDDKTFTAWLLHSGFPVETHVGLKALLEPIPPSADLIRMVVREAFDPKMVVEAPKVFADYMLKQGYKKEWSDRYWTAHFEPIELRQAYENLWRGNWDEDSFRYALYIKDIHPNWWDDILAVAYQPPGMRELGYGFDVGVYTEKDIAMYRRWGGLSPEDAEKAAKSMVAYRTEAEREAVRREHMHLYAIGREKREDFEANLKRLGTAAPAVLLWLERGDLEKSRLEKEPAFPEQRSISSSEALSALKMGTRDEAWTRARLADLNWTPERIDLAIETAEWQDSAGDEIRKHRSVLEAKLKEGFLKKDAFETGLMTLGFTPAVIAALGEWADEAAEWDDISEQASAWWTLAKAGKITSEEYGNEVRKLGMVETRITSKQKLLAKLAEIRAAEEAAKAKT